MRYIAALDYAHLDNGMFLTALAQSISRQGDVQPVIVHGESDYTERIIQTGVMREEAAIRSIKGLNHRLINLFADEGVSAVGINGYQRKLITQKENQLSLDTHFFKELPEGPVLLISTLVWDEESGSPRPVSLSRMAAFLQDEFEAASIYTFTTADKDEIIISEKPDELTWDDLPEHFAKQNIPAAFQQFNRPMRLSTARDFGQLPDEDPSILIR
jgi:hypothetical protein